ncbi:MAG TPA: UDP-N-acetylglucosamine 2-epimerase (non-hydrolyzing) [Bacteroidaceae bacterium]|nr:UDP-N-acetylglucosamine 2-epimerase (non-hydrolyzing) [Bacteroidaceae bacterium]
MKIVTVIGARPQFIKAAVVSRAISKLNIERKKENLKLLDEVIVHTGQHYDKNMSDIFFTEMKIPKPTYNLGVNNLSHGAMTGQMLEKIELVLIEQKPDLMLVYGDTDSTLAGALAAVKLNIPIAHVEAGLRSYNMFMPEEVNRILTDRIATLLFCPTEQAVKNLMNEDLTKYVLNCGDVMQDAAIFYANRATPPPGCFDIGLFTLCTIHRAENTDNPERISGIFRALEEIALERQIVLPLHPRTLSKLINMDYDIDNSKIHIIKPVGYLEMQWLLLNCNLVMTDSGGVQKEAYFSKKPCLTLRNETEWTELVEQGYNKLVGFVTNDIMEGYRAITKNNPKFDKKLYGSGNAGNLIAKTIVKYLENAKNKLFNNNSTTQQS